MRNRLVGVPGVWAQGLRLDGQWVGEILNNFVNKFCRALLIVRFERGYLYCG